MSIKFVKIAVASLLFFLVFHGELYADPDELPDVCECEEGYENICSPTDCTNPDCCVEVEVGVQSTKGLCTLVVMGLGLGMLAYHVKEKGTLPLFKKKNSLSKDYTNEN